MVSWWQEFGGEAVVGEMTGKRLEMLPLSIVPWKEFKAAFASGQVLSRAAGHRRPYGSNPYTGYDTSGPFLYEGPEDRRLPATERVVAIEIGGEAASAPDKEAIAEGRDVGAAAVFDPHVDGDEADFRIDGDRILDEQTRSIWNLLGRAQAGPLAGRQLTPLAYRAAQFWFSWVVFRPDTKVYRDRGAG